MTAATDPRNPLRRVLSLRDFRLLIAGAGTSLLGDQFSLIATPWLVLRLTGDARALGLALALQGVPRAVLMLVGGAVADRLSPRRVMLAASIVRGVLTALLAASVATGAVRLWMVFVFSALFGVVAGFAVPAENSIVPRLTGPQDLQAGNALMMGVTQLAGFVGPTIAGIVIGRFTGALTGVGVAFTVDAATFSVSVVSLLLMRPLAEAAAGAAREESVLQATAAGVRYLWSETVLRQMFLVLTAVNFLLMGPLTVGIPLLADRRLSEGATAYGLLMSAFAIGNLAGYLVSGALPKPGPTRLRSVMILLVAAFGVIIGALGTIPWTWVDFVLLAGLGLGNGFMAVILISWMQARTPARMTGRMMGLLMLSSTGLAPVSQAASGFLSADLTALFMVPGALVVLVAVWMCFAPALHRLGADPGTPAEQADQAEKADQISHVEPADQLDDDPALRGGTSAPGPAEAAPEAS